MRSGLPHVRDTAFSAPRSVSRLERLEAELARAHDAQQAQAAAVEDELSRLSSIYDRLKTDLKVAQEERDRAVAEAQQERERRERQAAELKARLRRAPPTAASADASTAEFVQRRLPPEPTERKELLPGHLPDVPGFQVIGMIGRGGMASVFRARRETDNREVALKLLTASSGSSRARTELFLREAAMMLQVDHPGLLRALDAGECSYGHFLVLPLIEGRSLAGRVRRGGPLSEQEAVRVAIEAGRALRYCARGGLTHRDVKPSNLLQDPSGRILLCDFGLAAMHTGDAGRPYGSPGFAAPEQILTPGDVDERADIYGLGTTLWCLVVGRRPFEGDARVSFEAARKTDLSDPRLEGGDISPRLARVIRRMGRCDRARRYRNWDECLLDLMLVEKGNPPLAAQLSEALGTDRIDDPGADPPASRTPTSDAELEAAVDAASRSEGSSTDGHASLSMAPRVVPRTGTALLAASVLLTLVLGTLLAFSFTRSPTAALEQRARALAAEGRHEEAADALRNAADLLEADEAVHLRRIADEIARSR